MDLSITCLGALRFGPASGYALRERINTWFGHFRTVSVGSLYPVLGKLAAKGLVEIEGDRAASLDRRVHRITEAGLTTFRGAMAALPPDEKIESNFLATMFFADILDAEDARAKVDERLGTLQAEIRALLALQHPDMSEGQRLSVRYALVVRRAAVEFLRGEGQALMSEMHRRSI